MTKKYNGRTSRTIDEYTVRGCKGYTVDEIVDFCDDGNFGGVVHFSNDGNSAWVEVYID